MMKKMLAATAIALGAAAMLAPTASADEIDNNWYDATGQFVGVLEPGGIDSGSAAQSALRSIVVSPWGTSRLIECRGDGHYVVKQCRQEGHWLVDVASSPFRDTWVYNPF
ncbi:hypothetical protein QMK17_22165 [Rhodococcus sp. G-MC3]|uniref:hypothetical protein n=1 Tax=Rhodococcus sp. G-MC3 TaxID=3046209 RepID=UPI0024BA16BF|nr:hypothetical protein [Rhodococcus sp. G-MC3]MDJ0396031.1 hypothetical protein [Rhodococcus sp. G-MC3]